MIKELKGRHVLAIALTAFAVIITANMAMLFAATGSFPGLVVKNSYVATQGWNARAAAQDALGWSSEITYGDGVLSVSLESAERQPLTDLDLIATVGRPTTDALDQSMSLVNTADGYRASVSLGPGLWRIELKTTTGPAYRKTAEIFVPGKD